ncbi:hypothetical protein ACTJIJ_03325 [Niabella sp. 22666]|uniref:hypothetical protein n=1 Tax=Niabella sp. 22666 TaxID=3453954 RepID=UPI003F844AB9
MTNPINKSQRLLLLAPVAGVIIFALLYFIATLLYPGGSQFDKNAVGFSWRHNYWCNLLNEYAINGNPNPAKPVAISGMLVLCVTLALFWFLFPGHINVGKRLQLLIQVSGAIAMAIAFFLFWDINHDLVINLASFFGLIATIGTFIGLYKAKWYGLFVFGLFNVVLVGLNNYFYYTDELIIYLPVIQKISFAAFLLWLCGICIQLYRDSRSIE